MYLNYDIALARNAAAKKRGSIVREIRHRAHRWHPL